MEFRLKIENFGKLSDAEIRIGRFTVLAGPNNTGKSSVSKLLYSLLDGMSADNASAQSSGLAESPRREMPGEASVSFVEGARRRISENLARNFQVPDIALLKTDGKKPSRVSIDGIGEFEFEDSAAASFNMEESGLRRLGDCSGAVYLEPPVHWKLKSAMESPGTLSGSPAPGEKLNGVPGYFYDLAGALKGEYAAEVSSEEFQELYEKLISDEVLGGKLAVSETGELVFRENERSLPLHLAAAGVVNLGILALLMERGIIGEGSFLFVDGPETHLNPEWQVETVRTLFDLSALGVNVVTATHSADILKFLEVKTKKNPERKKLAALNHFSTEGIAGREEDDFDLILPGIQQELTRPFANLYLEGL